MSEVLAYCPETLEKSKGEWQTYIGNFVADITFDKKQPYFSKKTKQIYRYLLA